MRLISKSTLFAFIVLSLFSVCYAEGCCSSQPAKANTGDFLIKHEKGILTIENTNISRQFNTKGQFYPTSFVYKKNKAQYLSKPSQNWFEVGVAGKVLNSAKYISHKVREMKHGGREVNISLRAKNANINYVVQIFPGSAVTREKLILSPKDKSITLTYIDDRVRLVFPRYNFFKTDKAEEIRLAAWMREQMPDAKINAFPATRTWDPTEGNGVNLSQCHMYHPDFLGFSPAKASSRKGPILIAADSSKGWLMAYEHGSPDNDPTRNYLEIATKGIETSVVAQRGVYLDGQVVTKEKPYETVWVITGVFEGSDLDTGRAAIWNYLYKWQSENPATRKPTIYYNTWGWQRDDQKEYVSCSELTQTVIGTSIARDPDQYEPLTYYNAKGSGGKRKTIAPVDVLHNEKRLLKEIDFAHQIGADVFVLDDGWFDWVGDWNLNKITFPNGLKTLKDKLDGYGMRLGFWMAPYCLNQNSKAFAEHPEFMALDKDGKIQGSRNMSWGYMTCMTSDYDEFFIEKCKKLIDMGGTYFKWDGFDGKYCYAANHYHGGANDNIDARGENYGYEFINAVTRIAKELTDYQPNLLIVYDVTEKGRNIGLEFLSAGRYFWMNNGATWYDDLSTFRAKSMRLVPFKYNQIIPSVLQTYATYPHDKSLYKAQEYNACTTMLGGGGFWGDLSEMSGNGRKTLNKLIEYYRAVAPTVVATRPKVTGIIGSSPEIYEFVDSEKAEGQVIAYSASVVKHSYLTKSINKENLLGVLRHAYELESDKLKLDFEFTEPDSVRQAFILGQNNFCARIEKSTCWLKEIKVENKSALKIANGAPGTISVVWPEKMGEPTVQTDAKATYKITKADGVTLITIEAAKADAKIKIISKKCGTKALACKTKTDTGCSTK
ncbi:MAG: alpha-galactosidase [Planctomycetes bacterium]|nr:alpha-galactosidase [Planctomycetota bacterium]